MWNRIVCAIVTLLTCTAPLSATPREARIPLHEGKIRTSELSDMLCRELNLPECSFGCGDINVNGLQGSRFVQAMNQSLGDGCRVSVSDESLVLHFDADKLPADMRSAKKAARVFTTIAAPDATARQMAYYGLWSPDKIDTAKPLVVLVHGLDCDRINWEPMADLLRNEGRQVALFTYPSDQPIAESAVELGNKLAELRAKTPGLSFDLICHSMGGLVARAYVEGDTYNNGGIHRLIMLGTPNRGTNWATYRLALEIDEHFDLWRHEPNWSPSWMITDGLGEAGDDLKPKSDFLKALNAHPRRDGVKYTIIAGNLDPARRMTANCLENTAGWIPNRVSNWWGFRQTKNKLAGSAQRMRERGRSDGPVGVSRCKLKGVEDFVIVAADHATLLYPVNGKQPAAWDTIRDRLTR
jgi:pimeloyl-ACP methyl ester carboxylesterase